MKVLVNSPNLQNLDEVSKFSKLIGKGFEEVANQGFIIQLNRAVELVTSEPIIHEGIFQKGDILRPSILEAIQVKSAVKSIEINAFNDNIIAALRQFKETEIPPVGYSKVVEYVVALPDHPLRNLEAPDIAVKLSYLYQSRRTSYGVDLISLKEIRIFNSRGQLRFKFDASGTAIVIN